MVENRDWVTYRIAADTQKAFFIVQFKSGVIEQVRITLALDGDDPKRWTIASEAARKSLHDRMLREQIGLPPYRFDWGKIESVSDARNGASEIIVTYE